MYTFSRRLAVFSSLVALFVVGTLTACGPTISQFNETAYQQATALKVESVRLMDAATEPYDEHADSVRALKKELDKALEYAKGRPRNEITTKQWEILIDADGNLLGGFLARWKQESTLNEVYVSEKKEQVREAFNTIIELESGKIKPGDVQNRR